MKKMVSLTLMCWCLSYGQSSVGGIKEDKILYLDVTEYIKQEASSSSAVFAFKLFTNSIIITPIAFGSSESPNESDRPQLQFYSSTKVSVPYLQWYVTSIATTENTSSRSNKDIEEVISPISDVTIYPNPVSITTTIENAMNSIVNVYDNNGKVLVTKSI